MSLNREKLLTNHVNMSTILFIMQWRNYYRARESNCVRIVLQFIK